MLASARCQCLRHGYMHLYTTRQTYAYVHRTSWYNTAFAQAGKTLGLMRRSPHLSSINSTGRRRFRYGHSSTGVLPVRVRPSQILRHRPSRCLATFVGLVGHRRRSAEVRASARVAVQAVALRWAMDHGVVPVVPVAWSGAGGAFGKRGTGDDGRPDALLLGRHTFLDPDDMGRLAAALAA